MMKFKACPRCRGDIAVLEDIYGKYLSCLQCGYLKDLVPVDLTTLTARNGGRSWGSAAVMQALMEQG